MSAGVFLGAYLMEATDMSEKYGWRIEWNLGIAVLLLALMVLFIVLAGDNFPSGIFIAVLSVLVFLGVFVGSENKQLWFSFAYGFTLAALALATAPFIFLESKNVESRSDRAITLLVGCIPGDDAPDALQCPEMAQWVVSIGGTTRRITAEMVPPGIELPPDLNSRESVAARVKPAVFEIRGGLVVPLYFVVLALLGGAVSLTRRVPEYQKRAAADYTPTEKQPALSDIETREYLVFQIVQFISAPLIAVTAYHALKPSSPTTIVALGFISGFSSETILLWIRAVVTKVKPDAGFAGATGAACGEVKDANGLVNGGQVTLLGSPGIRAETDANGLYTLDSVPEGDNVLEFVEGARRQLKDVKVEAGRAVRCDVTL